jgi:hypothetical protein
MDKTGCCYGYFVFRLVIHSGDPRAATQTCTPIVESFMGRQGFSFRTLLAL